MVPETKLMPDDGAPLHDPKRYRRLVGKLNYLTVTRPNIAYPVTVVCQFMSAPHTTHWDAAIRILRYLKGSPGKGLVYSDQGHSKIAVFTVPIGQVVLLVEGPLLDIVSSLVVTLYPGRVRNNQLYLDPVRSQNIAQWQTHPVS